MDQNILEQLKRISESLPTIAPARSHLLIQSVARKLGELFGKHSLVRVYRAIPAEGSTILELVADYPTNTIEHSLRRIPLGNIQRKGPLSWCIDRESPFWVENIEQFQRKSELTEKFSGRKVGRKYGDFYGCPNAILAIPVMNRESTLVGVLSIQLGKDDCFTSRSRAMLKQLVKSLARILQKAKDHERHDADITSVIDDFLNEIASTKFPDLQGSGLCRNGFVARPFQPEFEDFSLWLSRRFEAEGVKAVHFSADEPDQLIQTQIVDQIRKSHFLVADITDRNHNVLTELGVALAFFKNILLLRKESDNSQIPFNIAGYPVYHYSFDQKSNSFLVRKPGSRRRTPMETLIRRFVAQLEEQSPEFREAEKFEAAHVQA